MKRIAVPGVVVLLAVSAGAPATRAEGVKLRVVSGVYADSKGAVRPWHTPKKSDKGASTEGVC